MNSSRGRVECPSVNIAPSGHCASCGNTSFLMVETPFRYDTSVSVKFVARRTAKRRSVRPACAVQCSDNVRPNITLHEDNKLPSSDITQAIDSLSYDGFVVKPAFIDPNG